MDELKHRLEAWAPEGPWLRHELAHMEVEDGQVRRECESD